MSTDDHTDPRTDDVENISFSANELDDIVNSAEITKENVADDDLEEYGVWVKVGPEDVSEAADDLPSVESDAPLIGLDETKEDFLSEEEESLLGELGDDDIDLDIPDVEDFVESETGDRKPELDINFEPAEVESAAAREEPGFVGDDIEISLTDDSTTETGELGDLADLDVDDAIPLAMDTAPPGPAAKADGNTSSLLAKMERELLVIMEEITDVKRELSELRKSSMSSSEPKTEPTGFFDGDDDETIALTGDELDNILSSADITEEVAETEDTLTPLEIDAAADAPDTAADDAIGEDLDIGDVGNGATDSDSLIDGEDLLGAEAFNIPHTEVEPAGPVAEPSPVVEELRIDADTGLEELVLDKEPAALEIEELVLEEETAAPASEELILDEEPAPSELEELVLDKEPTLIEEEVLILEEEPAAAEDPLATPGRIELNQEIAGSDDALELLEEIETDEPDIDLERAPDAANVEDVNLSIDDEDQLLELVDEHTVELEATGDEEDGAILEIEEVADEPTIDIREALPDEHRGDTGTITLEGANAAMPDDLKQDIKSVLAYLDQLLDALPEDKIEEFAQSEHFGVYKKLFEKLGLED